jgi:hypothetical protein
MPLRPAPPGIDYRNESPHLPVLLCVTAMKLGGENGPDWAWRAARSRWNLVHGAERRIHPLAYISLHMTVSEPQALEGDRPR